MTPPNYIGSSFTVKSRTAVLTVEDLIPFGGILVRYHNGPNVFWYEWFNSVDEIKQIALER